MLTRPSSTGRESVSEAHFGRTKNFRTSDDDGRLAEDNLLLIGVNRGNMIDKRMDELVSRYGVPLSYVYKIPTIIEYISMPGPLKIGVCEKTFRVRFWIPIHLFIKELVHRYGLILAQIHPNAYRAIYSFMIKCMDVKHDPWMKALRSVLSLKWSFGIISIMHANYKRITLAHLFLNSLHKWQKRFLFYSS